MLNLLGFMVTIPVADRFSVIAFDSPYRDRWRDNILCQIFCESLTAGWHISGLKKSDKSFWIIFPCPVNIFFDSRIGNIFSEHFQEMVLPFSVHHVVWDIRDGFPLTGFVNSSSGHEDMKMRIIIPGTSCSLQNDNISNIEFGAGTGIENIF